MQTMKNHHLGAALAAAALALAPAAALAGPTGNVLSNNLRDADGTSGQSTTTGSGVKTGHLQNGAVTAPKLAPAAVGTAAIQDGAVTAAKLSGTIPSAKIDRTGLDADTLDGVHATSLRKKLRNVLVVSKDGNGDFVSPLDALASITDASEANPYVVRIAPGTYDLGASALAVKAYVSVVGSGEQNTILTGTTGEAQWPIQTNGPGVVLLDNHAALSDLAVRVLGAPGVGSPAAIQVVYSGEAVRVERVTATVDPAVAAGGLWLSGNIRSFFGARLSVTATTYALYAMGDGTGHSGGAVEIADSSFALVGPWSASGYAGYAGISGGGSLRIRNTRFSGGLGWRNFFDYVEASNVEVSGGFVNQRYFYDGSVTQRVRIVGSSIVAGTGAAIDNWGGDLSIANTRIEGTLTGNANWGIAPVLRCMGNFDASFAPLTCP